jgi:hypothetical protein
MRRQRGYFVGGLGTAAAVLVAVVALEAQITRPQVLPAPGIGDEHRGMLDRSLKGDRFPLIPGPTGSNPAPRAPTQPAGCAGGPGPKAPFSTEVPGRCVALVPGFVHGTG